MSYNVGCMNRGFRLLWYPINCLFPEVDSIFEPSKKIHTQPTVSEPASPLADDHYLLSASSYRSDLHLPKDRPLDPEDSPSNHFCPGILGLLDVEACRYFGGNDRCAGAGVEEKHRLGFG